MGTRLILDEAKYRLFMEENSNWKDTIKAHTTEIPAWEKMMAAAFEKKEKEILAKQETYYTAKEMEISNNHFTDQLLQQQKELIELHAAIEQQQSRLIQNCEAKKEHDIESLCTQDILRDRIKDIEKTYIELKCNFMRYFSTIL